MLILNMNNRFDQLAIFWLVFFITTKNSIVYMGWVVGFGLIRWTYLEGVPLYG